MPRRTLATVLIAALLTMASWQTAQAQLASAWVVPAAAHNPGVGDTFWRTDLSLHNPHQHQLQVALQVLVSDRANWEVPTFDLVLEPYETVNLWDAMGPATFDVEGTAALLAYADPGLDCGDGSCEFLVTSRTYTVVPWGGPGEFGQTVPGVDPRLGTDWWTYGYVAGILNDGEDFRCNVGVASWTPGSVVLRVDVQDGAGNILASEELDVPAYGHRQRRLATPVVGGSLVFYLVSGDEDALVFPYVSTANQETGDASFAAALPSDIGVSIPKRRATRSGREVPRPDGDRRPLETGVETRGPRARPALALSDAGAR